MEMQFGMELHRNHPRRSYRLDSCGIEGVGGATGPKRPVFYCTRSHASQRSNRQSEAFGRLPQKRTTVEAIVHVCTFFSHPFFITDFFQGPQQCEL